MKPSASSLSAGPGQADDYRIRWMSTIPFWAVHVVAVAGVVWLGWSWSGLALAVALYFVRMFGITAGFHRYFSHRSFKTGRVMQFLLALLGGLSTQKGVLWWAAHHRNHHKYSDEPEDVHSPRQRGFFWSHVGWILVHKHDVIHWDKIPDLARYPELRFLTRFDVWISAAFAVLLYVVGGAWALIWGYFVSTMLLWHGTFTINSFSHIIGRRRYETEDDSKNNWLLALLTMGEGWHNNHHYYQRSVRQGFYWWEIDLTYYVLVAMSWLGLVSELHTVPTHVRDPEMARERLARKAAGRADEVGHGAASPNVVA
jgi:stearoyl-CoA desaturase (delta-9 desaturase)